MTLSFQGPACASAGRLLRAGFAGVMLGAASCASAFFDDRLQLFVGEAVTHDSNVFRISEGAAPSAVIGSSERSDTFHATTVGAALDMPISRQRVQAGMSWSQVRFNRFTQLDHLERDGHVDWLWQGGNAWNGRLGYAETRTLASFTNFVGAQGNLLTTKALNGTAAYLVNPHWQFEAIGSEIRQRNALDARRANDVDLGTVQVGLNYISTASNRVGLNVRQEEGRYPNAQSIGGILVKNDYTQHSVGAMADWTMTVKSHLLARADYVRRDYDQFSGRDFSGSTFRLGYDWMPTAKTSLSTVLLRDIASSEDLQTNMVLVKGITVTPSYAISDKLRLSASLSSNIRDYQSDAGASVGAPTLFAGRKDRLKAAVLSLSYQPLRSLLLLASLQRETRSSNRPLLDYSATIASISARLTF